MLAALMINVLADTVSIGFSGVVALAFLIGGLYLIFARNEVWAGVFCIIIALIVGPGVLVVNR